MQLNQLSTTELLRHAQCQPELTELEETLAKALEEEPDEDLESEIESIENDAEYNTTHIQELKAHIEAIDEALNGDDSAHDQIKQIKESIDGAIKYIAEQHL